MFAHFSCSISHLCEFSNKRIICFTILSPKPKSMKSKQRVSFFIGFLLVTAGINAQPEVGSLFFTPHVGFNVSTLLGHTNVRVQYVWDDGLGAASNSQTLPKLGISGGLGLEYQMKKKWALSVGIAANELGVRFRDFTFEDHTMSNAYIHLFYSDNCMIAM